MWNGLLKFLRAPVFEGDEDKTRRARALNALHLNVGGVLVFLGGLAVVFLFKEKFITTIILGVGIMVVTASMILNRRGWVSASGISLLASLWVLTVVMAVLSGGMRSHDIIFFISGTVIAGIILGAQGALVYAGLSLLAGLVLILAEGAGVVYPQLFQFPPLGVWAILFINLVFTVVPLQVTFRSLSESASRAQESEELYRLIASVISDYVFSIQYGPDGQPTDEWYGGAFEAITGYTPAECIAMGGWHSIVHPDDRERDEQDTMGLRANRNMIADTRIVRKDGGIRWVRSYAHPKWDEKENRLAGVYGAVQDVTGSKNLDVELHQRAEEVALLYRLGLALTSGQNLYQTLRAFVRELKEVMIVDAFHVGLYDAETDDFSYPLFLNLNEDLQLPPRKLHEKPGLTWEVISSGKTLYLQDVADPDIQQKYNIVVIVEAPIHSYIGIPLILQERVIGVMSVQSLQPAAYNEFQVRLLETLAAQVAITIEKLRLLDQVQQELAERKRAESDLQEREAILEVVADAANTFLKISEWDATAWRIQVDRLLERLGTTINASHAYIFENHIAEDGSIRMSMRYEWSAPGIPSDMGNLKYINMPLDVDYLESWNQSVMNGHPFIGDEAHLLENDLDDLKIRGIRALLDVPIFIDNHWWGTIGFDDMRNPRAWSNAEIDALILAGNMLGAAIKRRQMDSLLQNELRQRKALIEELKERNAESETLRESAAIVAATLDRNEAVSLILDQIARVVPYKSASVQLISRDMLEIVSSRGLPDTGDIGMKFPLNEEEPAYLVIRGKIPYILFKDVQASVPAFNEPPHDTIRAWMAVPLKVKGKIMGIIALDGHEVGQFSEKDAELAATYANQVAIALENSRLFSELQAQLSLKQILIEELESKNTELERFTYTVSHDLRSPLVTIRGFLGYLEKSASAGNMISFRKDMDRISEATLRMDSLLKDVLELSRIGRVINKPQLVSFDELVHAALIAVHGGIEQRGVTLQTQPGLPAVYGDKPRLIEVLQNLLENAVKYMGDQTEPHIEIGAAGEEDGKPVFYVKDNGMGIALEYTERIFGLFEKLDPKSDGTGIGLALVKRIIEFHGGRIWVESEPEIGSTFFFTLPAGNEKP